MSDFVTVDCWICNRSLKVSKYAYKNKVRNENGKKEFRCSWCSIINKVMNEQLPPNWQQTTVPIKYETLKPRVNIDKDFDRLLVWTIKKWNE